MVKFIKWASIALSSFGGSLTWVVKVSGHTQSISLKEEPCLARTILIHLNSFKLNFYHPSIVS